MVVPSAMVAAMKAQGVPGGVGYDLHPHPSAARAVSLDGDDDQRLRSAGATAAQADLLAADVALVDLHGAV